MRIAHFLGTIRPEHDGVTRVMYQLIPHYNKAFTYDYVSPILPLLPDKNMHKAPSIGFPLSTDYRLAIVGKNFIEKLFNKNRPDVVHIHTPCPLGVAAAKYASEFNIPYVITFHTHFPSYLKHYKVGFLEPLIWKHLLKLQKNAYATVTPSTALQKELFEKGFKNLLFIPHGVNIKDFNPSKKNEDWKNSVNAADKTILLFVSRLVEEKNLKILSEIPRYIKHPSKYKFVIVGDGPAREKLKSLMPDAFFTGYLTGEDLFKAYASSDIFVFPSLTETFGNVTAEALASGLISLCANKGAAGDLIKDNINGYLFSGHDAKEFAEKINMLLENPELLTNMKLKTMESIKELSWKAIAEKYENLYRAMVQNIPIRDAFPSTPVM